VTAAGQSPVYLLEKRTKQISITLTPFHMPKAVNKILLLSQQVVLPEWAFCNGMQGRLPLIIFKGDTAIGFQHAVD
jgi:hypothetical protein